jgi:hypothetical protein
MTTATQFARDSNQVVNNVEGKFFSLKDKLVVTGNRDSGWSVWNETRNMDWSVTFSTREEARNELRCSKA